MKKIFLIIITIFIFLLGFELSCIAKTPSPKNETQMIESLKEKIATKVAQLQKKELLFGTLEKKEKQSLSVIFEKEKFKVELDEILTKFYQIKNNSKKEISLEDLKIGDYLIITGPKIDNNFVANNIYVDTPYLIVSGKIIEVNKNDYSFRLLTSEKEEYIVDVETYTNQKIIDIKNFQTIAGGFSKIKEGDFAHVVAIFTNKEKRISALRILLLPQEYFLLP